eukprot:XP_001691533.1 RegA/RlsA-like protein [Chlamydomonas reinhardtii]
MSASLLLVKEDPTEEEEEQEQGQNCELDEPPPPQQQQQQPQQQPAAAAATGGTLAALSGSVHATSLRNSTSVPGVAITVQSRSLGAPIPVQVLAARSAAAAASGGGKPPSHSGLGGYPPGSPREDYDNGRAPRGLGDGGSGWEAGGAYGGGGGDPMAWRNAAAAAAAEAGEAEFDMSTLPAVLPPPVEVTVAVRVGSGDEPPRGPGGGYVKGHAVGLFQPQLYLARMDCIRYKGINVSRSNFEKVGGSNMAKWYRSIRVMPDLEPLGEWLERHGLPVLKGAARRSRPRRVVLANAAAAAAAATGLAASGSDSHGRGSPGTSALAAGAGGGAGAGAGANGFGRGGVGAAADRSRSKGSAPASLLAKRKAAGGGGSSSGEDGDGDGDGPWPPRSPRDRLPPQQQSQGSGAMQPQLSELRTAGEQERLLRRVLLGDGNGAAGADGAAGSQGGAAGGAGGAINSSLLQLQQKQQRFQQMQVQLEQQRLEPWLERGRGQGSAAGAPGGGGVEMRLAVDRLAGGAAGAFARGLGGSGATAALNVGRDHEPWQRLPPAQEAVAAAAASAPQMRWRRRCCSAPRRAAAAAARLISADAGGAAAAQADEDAHGELTKAQVDVLASLRQLRAVAVESGAAGGALSRERLGAEEREPDAARGFTARDLLRDLRDTRGDAAAAAAILDGAGGPEQLSRDGRADELDDSQLRLLLLSAGGLSPLLLAVRMEQLQLQRRLRQLQRMQSRLLALCPGSAAEGLLGLGGGDRRGLGGGGPGDRLGMTPPLEATPPLPAMHAAGLSGGDALYLNLMGVAGGGRGPNGGGGGGGSLPPLRMGSGSRGAIASGGGRDGGARDMALEGPGVAEALISKLAAAAAQGADVSGVVAALGLGGGGSGGGGGAGGNADSEAQLRQALAELLIRNTRMEQLGGPGNSNGGGGGGTGGPLRGAAGGGVLGASRAGVHPYGGGRTGGGGGGGDRYERELQLGGRGGPSGDRL